MIYITRYLNIKFITLIYLANFYFNINLIFANYISKIERYHTTLPNLKPGLKKTKPENIQQDKFNKNIYWVTLPEAQAIGMFNTSNNSIKYFYLDSKKKRPDGLAIDHNGNIWFATQNGGTVGVLNRKSYVITEYIMDYKKSVPCIVNITSNNNIIVTDHTNNIIHLIDYKNSKVTNIKLPYDKAWLVMAIEGLNNQLWYTTYLTNKIGCIDINSGVIKEFSIKSLKNLSFFAFDNLNRLWVTTWYEGYSILLFNTLNFRASRYIIPYFKEGFEYIQSGSAGIAYNSKLNSIVFTSYPTRKLSFINLDNDSFMHYFDIPFSPVFRESMLIDNEYNVWFTGTVNDIIYKLFITNYSNTNDFDPRYSFSKMVKLKKTNIKIPSFKLLKAKISTSKLTRN